MHRDKVVLIQQVARGLAHEIRNPLTSIMGLVKILREKVECNDEILKIIDIINSESDQLNSVVNTLVNLAWPVPPKLKLERLDSLLHEIISYLKEDTELNHDRSVCYVVNKEENFPEWLYLDSIQFKQVIMNLTLNAVQSISGKGVVAFNMYYFNSDKKIKLEILDTGCGIPQENLLRLGIPFFTTKPGGRGLGLSSSIIIVNGHGGKLEVDSEEGKGTAVSIYLPV